MNLSKQAWDLLVSASAGDSRIVLVEPTPTRPWFCMRTDCPTGNTEFFGDSSKGAAYEYVEALYELFEYQFIRSAGFRTFKITETGREEVRRSCG